MPDPEWRMGELAAWPEALPPQDSYPAASREPVPDAFERAAQTANQNYQGVQARAGTSRLGPLAESLGPREPWEYGAMMLGGPGLVGRAVSYLPRAARMGGLAAGIAATSTEAEAGSKRAIAKEALEAVTKGGKKAEKISGFVPGSVAEISSPQVSPTTALAAPYVNNPLRVANPGVYKNPKDIAREASEIVAPEHPAMKQLFGVDRGDLYDISQQGRRQGNVEPQIWMPSKGKGSYAADAVMTPQNAQRLVDTLAEAQKYPELIRGMDPWYVMDPMYQHMVKMMGPEEAKIAYQRFNASVGPFSAGSDVMTEINRGTAAHMALQRGEYDTFQKHAGTKESARGADFPDWLRDVKGHAYHGVQADPVRRWRDTGEHGYANDTVKIPLYMQASGVPETGFQTRLPVPDAHFTRALGMPDVRNNKSFNDYMGGSEYRPVGPWFRENVAKPLGIEAVPAQARMWGTYAPQTGVDTKIGAGKLELLSQRIWERAQKLGIDPEVLRDQVLRGEQHSELQPSDRMGGLAAQDRYYS